MIEIFYPIATGILWYWWIVIIGGLIYYKILCQKKCPGCGKRYSRAKMQYHNSMAGMFAKNFAKDDFVTDFVNEIRGCARLPVLPVNSG